MPTAYKTPQQSRALGTEKKFLNAMSACLQHKSLAQLTIDEIADHAGLTRSAFLKRFGTKKQALLLLYDQYCQKVVAAMSAVAKEMHDFDDAYQACYRISADAEVLQTADFSTNRAMHELFMEELTAHPQTKAIFMHCRDLMKLIQKVHLLPGTGTDVGAYAAAQLIFTINYNHVLKAMPGMPRDSHTRHQMIATLVHRALQF
jgi:AcrR family transcriptional regulator